jgi:DNA-directed RNA polymerase specialized sigma24 family protein
MTEIAIVAGAALVAGVTTRIVRSRIIARRRAPVHIHAALMRRAEAHADESPFLGKVCREFKANGHISDRQADAVAKALARLEERQRKAAK